MPMAASSAAGPSKLAAEAVTQSSPASASVVSRMVRKRFIKNLLSSPAKAAGVIRSLYTWENPPSSTAFWKRFQNTHSAVKQEPRGPRPSTQ